MLAGDTRTWKLGGIPMAIAGSKIAAIFRSVNDYNSARNLMGFPLEKLINYSSNMQILQKHFCGV
jgi:hypothetical protein